MFPRPPATSRRPANGPPRLHGVPVPARMLGIGGGWLGRPGQGEPSERPGEQRSGEHGEEAHEIGHLIAA